MTVGTVTRGRHASRRGSFGIALHLRARHVTTLVAGLAGLGLLTWLVADWLMSQPWSAGPSDRALLTRWSPAVAAALGSIGLAGEDEDMERSTAAPWRPIRAVHMTGFALLLAGVLALTAQSEPETFGAHVLARNTVACVGVVAALAAVVGARFPGRPCSRSLLSSRSLAAVPARRRHGGHGRPSRRTSMRLRGWRPPYF